LDNRQERIKRQRMKTGSNDSRDITGEKYWKIYGRLINSADIGTFLATTSWILFWLDHIPQHIFHSHVVTAILFMAALLSGLLGAWIMVRTGNMLGTKGDRRLHLLMIGYTILASAAGITAHVMFPAH